LIPLQKRLHSSIADLQRATPDTGDISITGHCIVRYSVVQSCSVRKEFQRAGDMAQGELDGWMILQGY
jgi:hypothetical protein